jgi:thiol-disulfide isomerase/thioredoxin
MNEIRSAMNIKSRALRAAGAFILVTAALATTACSSNDGLANQFKSGDNKNYIAGDGTVSEFAATDRLAPVSWQGQVEDGSYLSSENLSGIVTVVNFWYAGCAPCRAEAKDLEAMYQKFLPSKVQFVGVNVRDSAATALAFDRAFGITYPSIIDNNSGAVVLAFTGVVSPQAVPTTLVIDRKGRVAARVLGRMQPSILSAMIQRVVDEK